MDYDFYRFNSTDFEHLVQSLTQKLLGNSSIVYGIGPDGGRELTFEGKADFPNIKEQWGGYWVIQAKFKARDFNKENNYLWVSDNFRQEMLRFQNKTSQPPDNYLFVTNAVLSPLSVTGGRDKMEELKKTYSSLIPNIMIIAYDELCRLIDNNKDLRSAYNHLLTAGDIQEEILSKLGLNKETSFVFENEIREKKLIQFEKPLNKKNCILAIDFGTSYTLAAFTNNDQVIFVPSDKGQKIIPSVVTFFKNGSYIVGRSEFIGLDSEEQITVSNIKRDLGTSKEFKVFNRILSPEFIASLIIKSVKTNAEEYLGFEISEILLSRPTQFTVHQTNSLIEICLSAKLKIVRIYQESTSACLVFPEEFLRKSDDYKFVVFDLGGGGH